MTHATGIFFDIGYGLMYVSESDSKARDWLERNGRRTVWNR